MKENKFQTATYDKGELKSAIWEYYVSFLADEDGQHTNFKTTCNIRNLVIIPGQQAIRLWL